MFHGLAMAPYRNTLMQSYRFLSNAAGMGAVTRKQNKMLAAGDKAPEQIRGAGRCGRRPDVAQDGCWATIAWS